MNALHSQFHPGVPKNKCPADATQGLTVFQRSVKYAKVSETIHGRIRVGKNQHSFSLPSSCLHIWWSRMTGAPTRSRFNPNGNSPRKCSALCQELFVECEFVTKEAGTNSPPPPHRAAAGDGPLSRPLTAGKAALLAASVTADRWKQKWDTPARIWDDNEDKTEQATQRSWNICSWLTRTEGWHWSDCQPGY